MGDPRKTQDGDRHQPGKNDGLPSNPVAIIRYERARAETKRLQVEALELRKAGYSYREIAARQNCAVTTAANRVRKSIKKNVPQELIDSTRAIELDRIDTMTKMNIALMETAYRAGDMDTYFKAQDRVNALHDRRAKIVPIQQPTKLVIDQQISTQNEQDRELAELVGKEADQMQEKVDRLMSYRDRVRND